MAITRTQLLKELLPGLNELFKTQYRVFQIEQGTQFMSPETKKLMEEVPLQAAYDLWTVAFGNEIDNAEFYEKVEGNEYLKSISQYLYECELLKADLSTSRYYLEPFPKTVQPCRS
jgi:hypothetical protein